MEMEQAINLYKVLSKYPQASCAAIARSSSAAQTVINTVQTQRDLERAVKIKFTKTYCVDVQDRETCKVVYRSSPQELNNEIWNKESKSGQFRAIVRKVTDKKQEEKQYLEIWSGSKKLENFDVLASEKHGKIYDADGYFGCLEWSPNEDKLLYVAERKYNKAVSYFAKPNEDKEKPDKTEPGEEYVYREDWGEGLVGKHQSILCILTIASGKIDVVDSTPENVCVGQVRWLPGDGGIVFTGWHHEPYRLGLIYCPIRKSTIYHLNLETGKHERMSVEGFSSRCPSISPDGRTLVFLQNNSGGPHKQCSTLVKYDLETKATSTVVDKVEYAPGDEFPGLYSFDLPDSCWSCDGSRVLIHSVWKSTDVILVINTNTKTVSRLPCHNGCCMMLLCVENDVVVAECSSLERPHYLVVGKLPPAGLESEMQWTTLDDSPTQLDNISWKVITHQPTQERINQEYSELMYESILVYPTSMDVDATKSLVVFPHGGPHSVFTSSYMLYVAMLCKLGYSSLLINYRGSCGYGNDSIYSLPGNCGDQDVKDVQCAALEVIENEGYDKNRMFVWGGSHGGFLTCHLVGQYPGFYKAAVCRNPVINIATMTGSSDIPDWCNVEAGLDFDFKTIPSEKSLSAMWKSSPLQYVDQIETPMMIMVGTDDKRVPPKQSYQLYKALKSRNKSVRYIAYPDNSHPIVKVDSEADACINIYKWFSEHQPS